MLMFKVIEVGDFFFQNLAEIKRHQRITLAPSLGTPNVPLW